MPLASGAGGAGVIFVIVGAGFTLFPLLFGGVQRRVRRGRAAWAARAVPVPGEVVDVKWRVQTRRTAGDNWQTSRAHLILRYTTPGGEHVEVESFEGSSPPAARKGDSVTVLVDPDDPRRARIEGDGAARGVMAVTTGCLGAGFGLFGLAFIALGVAIMSS